MTIALLEWVCTSVFLIVVVSAIRAALGRRLSAKLRYALWAVVLIRLLVPVQLFDSPVVGTLVFVGTRTDTQYTTIDRSPSPPGPPDLFGDPTDDGTGPAADAMPGDVSTVPQAPVVPDAPELPAPPDWEALPGWLGYLGWAWLAGSVGMVLVLLGTQLHFAWRLRRRRVPLEGTGCPLRVYVAAGLPSPCLFGAFRPAVYVTQEAEADPVMLRHVLAHELTHFRHGDHIWSLLRCTALAVHWWDPLVWLAARLSRQDSELACDEGALKRLGDGERAAYGNTLLALVTAKPRFGDLLRCATTMAGDKKSLKERICRIACAPRRWLWAAVAAVLTVALACGCAFGSPAQEPQDDPGPAADPELSSSADPEPTPSAGQDMGSGGAPEDDWKERWEEHRVEMFLEPDLDRDGVTEVIATSPTARHDGRQVGVWQGGSYVGDWDSAELLWADVGYYVHAGWNAVFLCELDGEYYLLRYAPRMSQGACSYSYELFTLENGEETVVRKDSIHFRTDLGSPAYDGSFDPQAIAAFMDDVNWLLDHSIQLINTDEDLWDTFQKSGELEDTLSWLDWSRDSRDEEMPLLYDLVRFRALMEPYDMPTIRALSQEEEQGGEPELLLSYHGRQARFQALWDRRGDPDPWLEVVDLDGGGRDEIVAIVTAGNGTEQSASDLHVDLYVFDAETLEQYDTSGVVGMVAAQIHSTGDEESFYVSAPGMDRVSVPKSAIGRGEVYDALEFGERYYYFTLKDGKLFCWLQGFGSDGAPCGLIDVRVELVDGRFRTGGFEIVPNSIQSGPQY